MIDFIAGLSATLLPVAAMVTGGYLATRRIRPENR